MINILQRINVIERVMNVQRVCTNWRQICKDPCMWRVSYLDAERQLKNTLYLFSFVDRSQGQLVNITIKGFYDELLRYVAERSSQLRRLELSLCKCFIYHLPKALKKFPLLEELSLCHIQIQEEAIQTLGRDCPMLKTLKLGNQYDFIGDTLGLAIADNLPGLRHLQLSCCKLSDTGLRAILDRCRHLQLLDLQICYPIDLRGELGEICLQQIKCVKFTPRYPLKINP